MPDVSDDWLIARLRSNPEQGWRAFVDHYSATREWEEREFRKAITEWELDRYMEII